MGWDALFDFLGAGGGLLILLQWLSGIPRRRLELKRDREKTFRELLDDDMAVSYTHLTLPTKA